MRVISEKDKIGRQESFVKLLYLLVPVSPKISIFQIKKSFLIFIKKYYIIYIDNLDGVFKLTSDVVGLDASWRRTKINKPTAGENPGLIKTMIWSYANLGHSI